MRIRNRFGKNIKHSVENESGRFVMGYYDDDLTRPEYIYSGEVLWNIHSSAHSVSVSVQCDCDESFAASNGFSRLESILENAELLDSLLKKYTFTHLSRGNEMVEIWGSCKEYETDSFISPVSQQDFSERISVKYIFVYSDGSTQFHIDLDEMFTDHFFDIFVDENGKIVGGGLSN